MNADRISPAPWTATISTSVLDDKVYTIGEISHAPEGLYRGGVARLQSAEHIKGIGADEVIANAHLISAAPDLLAGGNAQTSIINRAQAILTSYLIPDGIDGPQAIDQLLGLLDGPDQRAAQSAWDAAIAKARGRA